MDTLNKNFQWDDFLAGDNHAIETFYKNNVQALFKYGLTLTPDEDLIQDCIHDVFLFLLENRKKLAPPQNIRFYLMAALKNAILMAYRKQHTLDKYRESLPEAHWIESETVVEQIIENEEEAGRRSLIDKAFALLTPRQREIMYQRYVTGLSLEEISKNENIEYQSVVNIIQRAVTKIRKNLDKK